MPHLATRDGGEVSHVGELVLATDDPSPATGPSTPVEMCSKARELGGQVLQRPWQRPPQHTPGWTEGEDVAPGTVPTRCQGL